jgi:hypothetical protein
MRYTNDSMEAAKHFSEGLRLFTKMIAREILQERMNTVKYTNIRQDFHSGIIGSLQDQEKLTLSVREVAKLLGISL